MLKKIKAAVTSLFMAGSAGAAPSNSAPPIDINKPVENPSLVAALKRMATDSSPSSQENLLRELNNAVYLMAIFSDELYTAEPDAQGRTVVEKDSKIKVIGTSDSEGNPYLPLFTDWGAIQKYIKEPVNTLVLPAADAWSWALNMGQYHGVVINPAENALPLSRKQIEFLQRKIEPNNSFKADK